MVSSLKQSWNFPMFVYVNANHAAEKLHCWFVSFQKASMKKGNVFCRIKNH